MGASGRPSNFPNTSGEEPTIPTDIQALCSQDPILDKKRKELGERCLSGPNATTLGYISNAATVRDLVGLADAIVGKNSTINYWGLSYGTLVGAWFVNMFPDRVGRVILDGVLDATRVASAQSYQRPAWGGRRRLHGFCDRLCPCGTRWLQARPVREQQAQDVVNVLNDAIKNHLTILRATMYSSLYQPQQWAEYSNELLPQTITTIENGTADSTGSPTKRDAVYTQNSYTEAAVVCADSMDADPSVNTTVVDVIQTWPVRSPERFRGPFNGTFADKVLLIGPQCEAAHMAAVLGDEAALVKQNGFGTIYQSSTCITDIITAYFNDGTVPGFHLPSGTSSNPTVCAIDDAVELFPGVKSVDVMAKVGATDLSARY
ncbi:hypothetical protein V8D89_013094 [Ganoderma adspersum]